MNYLYLAPNTAYTAFKIGFSNTPDLRLNGVVGEISYRNTYTFECGTNDAQILEDFCHKYFKAFKVYPYKEGDGYSEWYDFSIFKAVKRKVIRHIKLFEITNHCKYFDKFSEIKRRKYTRAKNKCVKAIRNPHPSQDNTAHPFAFRKLPIRIQNSKPKDFRIVDYNYASMKCKEHGITSARQYRAWYQVFSPQGFPANPNRSYMNIWKSWNDFLQCDQLGYIGTASRSVKAEDLIPHDEAVAWTQSQNFTSEKEFKAAWDVGKVLKGIPRSPQARYDEFYQSVSGELSGWKRFLGKTPKKRP